jgi:hypothetical protein
MVAASPAHAADLVKDHGRADAEAALENYLAGAGTPSWPVEAVEIHASIPRLEKTGRLQAIRSVDRPGDVRYQIVQLTGDATVKNQVIARYLNAQERASQMTPSSVALTPANYKFAYKGMVDDGERFAYPTKTRINQTHFRTTISFSYGSKVLLSATRAFWFLLITSA